MIPMDKCRGSSASMGGVDGGMSRGRKGICPVCGRRIGMHAGRAGRLYSHRPDTYTRTGPYSGATPVPSVQEPTL